MTKPTDRVITGKDEADFVARVQSETAKGGAVDETFGRCLRELMPVFGRWLSAERERGTEPDQILAVVPAVVTSIAFTATLNAFTDKAAVATMSDQLKLAIDAQWIEARKGALKM